MRSEQIIFDELASLCLSRGYIHVIAEICFVNTVVGFNKELSANDLAEMRSNSMLTRTEITTLLGLTMRGPMDFYLPSPEILSGYINATYTLLNELHQTMQYSSFGYSSLDFHAVSDDDQNMCCLLKQILFYSGESAYPFQYRDLTYLKYKYDSAWLLKNKSIQLDIGRLVCKGVAEILNENLYETTVEMMDKPREEWTLLPAFIFSINKLASYLKIPIDDVKDFVKAFALPDNERNETFTSMNAFNVAYAYPFIAHGNDEFILFQYYGPTEAFYETPFYWMCKDEEYKQYALNNRGTFAESFTTERLSHVFGADNVLQNVKIQKSKGKVLGEIDVLVSFGDFVIIVQAKSKKLTLEARNGNVRVLKDDFKKAVQNAVDQSFQCAELLNDPTVKLICCDGRSVQLKSPPITIFPITVLVDHYPALAFQARQFLNFESSKQIVSPLVTDVFTLDVVTEMLNSPLRFLNYLIMRARYSNRVIANHEHMILSYHLKKNLWFEDSNGLLFIDDDVSSDLDVAMAVRREGIPGRATPDGILTRYEGTRFASIISEIDHKEEQAAINLGLMLLELCEETVQRINQGIEEVLKLCAADGCFHNFVICVSEASTGLIVHCSQDSFNKILPRLYEHCVSWMCIENTKNWFGMALTPEGTIQLVLQLDGERVVNPNEL